MSNFFETSRPGSLATHGSAEIELPILYFRDDSFALFFTADRRRVIAALPSPKLHPVTLPGGKALLGIVAFNYLETSIGPYGEVGVVIPVVHGRRPPLAWVAGLLESRYPGFGYVVLHLPVTRPLARDVGRGEWGYTKFVADMRFSNTPEYHECNLSDEERHILTLRVVKQGLARRERNPLVTYSVRDGKLLKTTIAQVGMARSALRPRGSLLRLGNHPMALSIQELGISDRPLLSRYFPERAAILPAGEVVEECVSPLSGHLGCNRQGEHRTSYLPRSH